jgi:predicted nuclease with TOPRIM domain
MSIDTESQASPQPGTSRPKAHNRIETLLTALERDVDKVEMHAERLEGAVTDLKMKFEELQELLEDK